MYIDIPTQVHNTPTVRFVLLFIILHFCQF